MAHRIIIGNPNTTYHPESTRPKAIVSIDYEPNDSASVQEQTAQYKRILKLYLEVLHVADPEHHHMQAEQD